MPVVKPVVKRLVHCAVCCKPAGLIPVDKYNVFRPYACGRHGPEAKPSPGWYRSREAILKKGQGERHVGVDPAAQP